MTGTSMDGIDISLVQTNGLHLNRLNKNYFYKYSTRTKKILTSILKEELSFNLKRKDYLDEFITNEHYFALKNLDILKSCDLIGFHGEIGVSLPSGRGTVVFTFYAGVARSRSGSSSFTALALNKPSSSSSSSSSSSCSSLRPS